MKTRKIIYALAMTLTMAATSCDDYLDTENLQTQPAHDELTSLSALQATTAGLYASPWAYLLRYRMFQLGDARANNILNTSTGSNDWNALVTFNEDLEYSAVTNSWASLYIVVNQSNYVINDYAPYCIENEICSEEDANACIAEARFMRALAYWQLAIYWHDVPIIEDASSDDGQAPARKFEDVILYAICDAEYAAEWLPVNPIATGRVSRASAWALLSRLYLTAGDYAHGNNMSQEFLTGTVAQLYASDSSYSASRAATFFYEKAAEAARQGIKEGEAAGYGMMDDYEEIFRTQNNNCKEVLFAVQTVASSSSLGLTNLLNNMSYDRCVSGNYGVGYNNYASFDFVRLSIQRGGMSRSRANFFVNGETYSYLYHELDTCAHKGETWTVSIGNNGSLPIKKQVVGGALATDNVAVNGNTGFCTPMLRFSELELNLTEALMGVAGVDETSDATILEGVNAVRRRAHKMEIEAGTYPGDYGTTGTFNRDSLLQERRLEVFFEGVARADIVRRSFRSDTELQRMLDYCNNVLYDVEGDEAMGCNRQNLYYYYKSSTQGIFGSVTMRDVVRREPKTVKHNISEGSYVHSEEVGEDDNLWSMLYPPTDVSQDPNLAEAPVSFDFSEIIASRN